MDKQTKVLIFFSLLIFEVYFGWQPFFQILTPRGLAIILLIYSIPEEYSIRLIKKWKRKKIYMYKWSDYSLEVSEKAYSET